MATYFLTGATGFIGSRVARQLVEAGHAVRALLRDPWRAEALPALGVELRRGDVTEKDSMREAMRGVDGVFHVAGWYQIGPRDTRSGQRINVDGTRNVLELVGELGIPKAVYTSTVAVFGDTHGQVVDETFHQGGPWLSEYDRTKWVAHYEVAEPMMRDGLPLVVVQPGGVYGVGDASPLGQTIRQYLRRQLLVVPKGGAVCWGHVEDTAGGHLLAMEKGRTGQSYVIAGEPHTYVDAFRTAERIVGIPAPRVQVPSGPLKGLAKAVAVVERFLPLPPTYSSEYLRVAAGATYLAGNAKARAELGFAPRTLEEGFREVLPAERANLAAAPGP
jgi:nucleoside-diphosphate-sugar epimerase